MEKEGRYKHQLKALQTEHVTRMAELEVERKRFKEVESHQQMRLSQNSYSIGERDRRISQLEEKMKALKVCECVHVLCLCMNVL